MSRECGFEFLGSWAGDTETGLTVSTAGRAKDAAWQAAKAQVTAKHAAGRNGQDATEALQNKLSSLVGGLTINPVLLCPDPVHCIPVMPAV